MEPIKCPYNSCNKVYYTKFNLRRHINSYHLELKNFKCDICSKSFVSKQNLKDHHYIHSGEKPFLCPEIGCKKRFRQTSQLNVHLKTHKRRSLRVSQEIPPLLLSSLEIPLDQTELEELELPNKEESMLPPVEASRIQANVKLPFLPNLLNFI